MILSQYYEEVFGCKGANGVATPRPHGHSNFVGASSLLRLHCAMAMAAAMVTSLLCESHPPTRRWRGLPRRAPRRRLPPAPFRGVLAASEEEPRRQLEETINLLALDELADIVSKRGGHCLLLFEISCFFKNHCELFVEKCSVFSSRLFEII